MSDPLVLHEPGGTITVPGDVLNAIVRRAAEEVEAVAVRRRGVSVKNDRVEVALDVRYGEVLPAVAEQVQQRVAEVLRTTCGLAPVAVDVSVEELT